MQEVGRIIRRRDLLESDLVPLAQREPVDGHALDAHAAPGVPHGCPLALRVDADALHDRLHGAASSATGSGSAAFFRALACASAAASICSNVMCSVPERTIS